MMSDSDDEFDLGFSGGGGGKGKGKGKGKAAAKRPPAKKKAVLTYRGVDDLLAESERDTPNVERAATASALMGPDSLITGELRTKENKARVDATDAQQHADYMATLADDSIDAPGVIRVFHPPQRETPVELPFDVRCPRKGLKRLFEALERAATDPADLEELLREMLVPWVRQELGGKAPPEVCRWLLLVVATHGLPMVVLAAEEALLQLLAENDNAWKLRYEDVLVIWRGCGAVWVAERGGGGGGADSGSGSGGGSGKSVQEQDGEESGEEEEEVGDEDMSFLRSNLKPALNVVEACLRRGSHDMSNDELRELLLDLAAALLDEGVTGSCQVEVYRALVALVDAMPAGYYEDPEAFSSLVDGLCDPSARALQSRMTPLSFVVLGRNVPYERSPGGGGGGGSSGGSGDSGGGREMLSLRYQVCHRLLKERFLVGTSYASEDDTSVGFGRAIKVLRVLLDNEDDLLDDDCQEGYERQYVVLALANEMAASIVVVSRGEKPGSKQTKDLIGLLDAINKKLTFVMQDRVQMSKTLLDLMKSKYSPRLAASSGRQSTLSFANNTAGGYGGGAGGGSRASDDSDDDGMETDEFDESQ